MSRAGCPAGRLFKLATRMLAETFVRAEGAFPLIGVGGIDSGATAIAKIKAGATLLQLYTGAGLSRHRCREGDQGGSHGSAQARPPQFACIDGRQRRGRDHGGKLAGVNQSCHRRARPGDRDHLAPTCHPKRDGRDKPGHDANKICLATSRWRVEQPHQDPDRDHDHRAEQEIPPQPAERIEAQVPQCCGSAARCCARCRRGRARAPRGSRRPGSIAERGGQHRQRRAAENLGHRFVAHSPMRPPAPRC